MRLYSTLSGAAVAILLLTGGQVQANEAAHTATPTPLERQIGLLSGALAQYKSAANGGGWPVFAQGGKIAPGERDERILALRRLLALTGDLTPEQPSADDPLFYDDTLKQAVQRFQERHALEPDGVIGKATQQAVMVPVERRIAEMEVSLERMQALVAQGTGERYVLVNIPGYHLQAVENGAVALTSRIVVGRPDRRTPQFSRPIEQVHFNPAWHVPQRIASHDILRKVQKNPDYLRRAGFSLMDGDGAAIDPQEVDWTAMTGGDFPFRLRQRPGADNALGKVKFHLPGRDNIYLHSTGSPEYFAKAARALSSGCVRVEKAKELAHFVLAATGQWETAQVDRAYEKSSSAAVRVEAPVMVHAVYWPVWAEPESGMVHFHPDIYGHTQQRVAELMRAKAPMRLAQAQ